jgi:hypothetical protein
METMSFKGTSLLKSASLALILSLALPTGGVLLASPAVAATLPAPYVSRALDAVLIPVDAGVTSAFGLAAGSTGVLVLATQPGGLADAAGILPGDVIDFVGKKPVTSPLDLDAVVYYWLMNGIYDFDFRGLRNGAEVVTTTLITLESWEQVIEVTEVSSWSSYSYESFSYEEYSVEYSEEIVSSYEESSVMIEETASSEEFSEEMTSEEMTSEETVDESAVDEGAVDEAAADEGAMDEAAPEEDMGAEVDCPDGEVIDGACVPFEEPVEEEPVEEEAVEEEPVDEGGDAGGEEEIIEE